MVRKGAVTFEARAIRDDDERKLAFEIRRQVFVGEQNVPEAVEIDGLDETAVHFLCFDGEQAVGVGRLRRLGTKAKFERIATLASHRGRGVARQILATMEAYAVSEWQYSKGALNAQLSALALYTKTGWHAEGDIFMEGGMEHVAMSKQLNPPRE